MKLYRLAARCPVCSATPAIRVYAHEIEEKAQKPAELPIQTVKCGSCDRIYTITAAAYHDAA